MTGKAQVVGIRLLQLEAPSDWGSLGRLIIAVACIISDTADSWLWLHALIRTIRLEDTSMPSSL